MHIDLTYRYLTHHIVPGPQSLSYFVPLLILPIALCIPRHILSKWQSIAIFMPIVAYAMIDAWRCMRGIDVISTNQVLWCLYFLALRDPWEDFSLITPARSLKENDKAGQIGHNSYANGSTSTDHGDKNNTATRIQTYPPTLIQRIPWVLRLLSSIRLNSWLINLPSHDTHQPPTPAFRSRKAFLAQAALSFTRGYLILDLTSAYTSLDPYFTNPKISIHDPLLLSPRIASRLGVAWPYTVPLRALVVGAQAWALISQLFYLPAIFPVLLNGLGILPDEWSPHTWAAYYGPASTIFDYGVRGFWGRYWHQTMRHSCSAPGYALADAGGLSRGGARLGRWGVVSGVAFGLSGVVHAGLVSPEPLHSTIGVNKIRLLIAGFFWLQPIALLAEAVVSRLVRATGLLWPRTRWIKRVVNAVWVLGWFVLCLPLLAEAGRQLGFWRYRTVPFSLWRYVRGQDPVIWPFLKG